MPFARQRTCSISSSSSCRTSRWCARPLRGAATYQLPWFDAHLWAYAERFGIPEILSEDFQDGRRYGAVRIVNPFATQGRWAGG
jgi:predicted nucleic acid-binding protein